ncbi:MAG: hypothetical protein PHH26_07275 [Candidatus Thermoplasmatota archaeon]|nr:hypothetical protein [Candidatus Thermoplasmatota archaeon]
MAGFDGTPILRPMEWFTEEIILDSFDEDAELIVLELAVAMQTLEKTKRLLRE